MRQFGRHFLIPILFAALGLSAQAAHAAASPDAASQEPIQVKGDSVEYFQEDRRAVGTGNVSIDYQDVRLTADKITVYMDKKLALAEGHVKLVQKGSEFTGERAEFDFGRKVGKVTGMAAAIQPSFYGKAETVERLDENHYRVQQGHVTTCCGDSPFYKIQAQTIDVYPEDRVEIKNALILVRGVPVMYVPVMVIPFVDMDRFPIQVVPGRNGEWGTFLLSKWRYQLANSPELKSRGNVLLDWREKRGFGGGIENFYSGPRIGHGAARFYATHDDGVSGDVDPDRYRAQWRHQTKITPDTTVTAEINKISDRDLMKDFFFREEYERDAFPDNYVSVIQAKPDYTLSLLERWRMNDFHTVVERQPEVRFDTHQRALGQTPFYWREEIQASNLSKKFADDPTELDAVRVDTNQTLAYAGRLANFSVTPRVGTRQTFYSRGSRDVSDRDFVRGTFDPGLDVSTRFFKTYDTTIRAMGLDINQVRHIFAPTASYNFRPNPTRPASEIQQFDAIDAIDKRHFVRVNLENKLQTKSHGESGALASRDLARVIPFFDVDFGSNRLENVGIDVETRPYTWLGFETEATFNTRTRDIETANADVFFTKDPFRVAVGQRYVQEESAQTTLDLRWKISPDLDLKVYERYEFETNDSKEFEVTLSKAFDCVIVDVTYNHRDGDSIYFVFRLKGFPKASIGLSQSYNRPKASSARL